MTYLFFTNSLGQSSKSWKRSIDITLEEAIQTITAHFQPASKTFPYCGLDFQYGSNNFYIIQQLPQLPLPPKETHNFFFNKPDLLVGEDI
jgi:hypothetical protein